MADGLPGRQNQSVPQSNWEPIADDSGASRVARLVVTVLWLATGLLAALGLVAMAWGSWIYLVTVLVIFVPQLVASEWLMRRSAAPAWPIGRYATLIAVVYGLSVVGLVLVFDRLAGQL